MERLDTKTGQSSCLLTSRPRLETVLIKVLPVFEPVQSCKELQVGDPAHDLPLTFLKDYQFFTPIFL